MRPTVVALVALIALAFAACGPSRPDRDAEDDDTPGGADDAGTVVTRDGGGTSDGGPVRCVSHLDCGADQKCYSNYCVPESFCLTNLDCLAGQTCVAQIYSCRSGSQHDAGTVATDGGHGSFDGGSFDGGSFDGGSATCQADWQCPWGTRCVASQCQAESTDGGGSDGGGSFDGGSLSDGGTAPSCAMSADCLQQQVCFLGTCNDEAMTADGGVCDAMTCGLGSFLGGGSTCYSRRDPSVVCSSMTCLLALQSGESTGAAPCAP